MELAESTSMKQLRRRTPAYNVERIGVIMEPDLTDPREVEGVLNPAGTLGPDGDFYLPARPRP